MLEGPFNKRIVDALRARGLFAVKLADRFQFGIPDIYIQGGNWIEGKIIKCTDSNRSVNIWNALSGKQQARCERIWISGDAIIVAARVEIGKDARLFVERFQDLKERQSYLGSDLAQLPLMGAKVDVGQICYLLELP